MVFRNQAYGRNLSILIKENGHQVLFFLREKLVFFEKKGRKWSSLKSFLHQNFLFHKTMQFLNLNRRLIKLIPTSVELNCRLRKLTLTTLTLITLIVCFCRKSACAVRADWNVVHIILFTSLRTGG